MIPRIMSDAPFEGHAMTKEWPVGHDCIGAKWIWIDVRLIPATAWCYQPDEIEFSQSLWPCTNEVTNFVSCLVAHRAHGARF